MSSYDALMRCLSDERNFIVKLRFLEGLDRDSIQEFMKILDKVGAEIRAAPLIEKRLAFALAGTLEALYACERQYSGAKQQEIIDALGYVQEKICTILECET